MTGQPPSPGGRVIVVGSLNVDHTVRVETLPAEGATVAGHDYAVAPGGKGLNQAVAAARQGATVALIGAVGRDASGDLLDGVLTDEGIDGSGVRRTDKPSGTALITVAERGANTIVVAPGANGEVSATDVEAVDFAGAAVVLCQLEIPLDAVRAALAAGRTAGALTVLNPAPAPASLPDDLLGLVDLIVPNETEAATLTGSESAGGRAAAKAAGAALVGRGVGTALVTVGREGAVMVTSGADEEFLPFTVNAVDTTAAGDAFLGAVVAALAAGEPMEVAARRGMAAGALTTTRPGAVPSIAARAEVDALLASDPVSPGGLRSRPPSAAVRPGAGRPPQPRGGHGSGPGGPPRPRG